jgi:ABC-type anion transport system duplicated permease subunit
MKVLDVLRKLGIVRYGAKAATYTSGKDMPAEFLMDDVYNAQKDLTTRQDMARMAEGLKKSSGRKVLFWVTVALAVLALLLLTAAGGLSIWLVGAVCLWAGLLSLTHKFAYGGQYSYGGVIALVLIALVASFILMGVTVSG